MSDDEENSDHARPTVFLSYASEDRQAARLIGDALPAYGLEVWYDESELGGGDAWDQKIRRQIRDCDYFMALVSAQTEARHEGYFRREWRLAVERTHDMADDHTFLLPVAIDETDQATARVPEKFQSVQWLRVLGGAPTPALEALCRRLVAGETFETQRPKKAPHRPRAASSAAAPAYPEFPREEPGQRLRFWFGVVGWALRSVWVFFRQLPRWIRIIVYVWIGIALVSKGCTPREHHAAELSPNTAQKLKTISDQYQGSSRKADIAKLEAQIAREFSANGATGPPEHRPLLVLPFTAPAGDAAAEKLADSTFAQVYGRISISHPTEIGLTKEPLASNTLGAALERGRANHSAYILWGAVDGAGAKAVLSVKIATVADGSVLWSKSYAGTQVDPAKVAVEIDSKVPSLDSE